VTSVRRGAAIELFLERLDEDASEVVWLAALALLERTLSEARRTSPSRWRHYPAGELRRLRDEIASALSMARFAVALAEESSELDQELAEATEAGLEEQLRQRLRAGTIQAERTRLARPHGNGSGSSGLGGHV